MSPAEWSRIWLGNFILGPYLEHTCIWFRRTLHGYCNVFITVIVIEMEMRDVIVLSKARIRCFYSILCVAAHYSVWYCNK